MRGGTYKFHALDIDTFRNETCQWISEGRQKDNGGTASAVS